MNWRYELTSPALKDLRKLDRDTQKQVIAAIQRLIRALAAGTSADIDVSKVKGKQPPEWRMRVGDYRIRFTRDSKAMLMRMHLIRHRRDAYR